MPSHAWKYIFFLSLSFPMAGWDFTEACHLFLLPSYPKKKESSSISESLQFHSSELSCFILTSNWIPPWVKPKDWLRIKRWGYNAFGPAMKEGFGGETQLPVEGWACLFKRPGHSHSAVQSTAYVITGSCFWWMAREFKLGDIQRQRDN